MQENCKMVEVYAWNEILQRVREHYASIEWIADGVKVDEIEMAHGKWR